MATLRNSRQRTAVLEELSSRCDHPTAEQLYLQLKKKLPSLSLATVYRNLRILQQEGKVVAILSSDAEHFDISKEQHYHLTCRKCGKIVDVQIENSDWINSLVCGFGGKVEDHSLMFYGLCPQCCKKDGEKAG
ncbi:MAG: transcriptional repressor [Acutalibacteraceae bacterium]